MLPVFAQMKTPAAILLPFCLLFASAQTREPQTKRITAAEILAKYVEATGGLEARKGVSTLEVHGAVLVVLSSPRETVTTFIFILWRRPMTCFNSRPGAMAR